MIEYELGQAVRLVASFVNGDQIAADPTTVAFKYGVQLVNPPPDPTATTVTFPASGFTKDSIGNYHYDFVPAVAGNYVYTAVGTGAVSAVTRGFFRVKPSPFV